MSAQRHITGLKPQVESLWAAGKSIEAITNDLGLTRRAVIQVVSKLSRYGAEPVNLNNNDGHINDVLDASPHGFPFCVVPAAYRVRA
jgi:hypothetical protein